MFFFNWGISDQKSCSSFVRNVEISSQYKTGLTDISYLNYCLMKKKKDLLFDDKILILAMSLIIKTMF